MNTGRYQNIVDWIEEYSIPIILGCLVVGVIAIILKGHI